MLTTISTYYCTYSVVATADSFTIIIMTFDKRFKIFRNKRSAFKHAGSARIQDLASYFSLAQNAFHESLIQSKN